MLVVEDEYFIAQDIRQALQTLGAIVIGPVASRDEAMRRLEQEQPFDLAILDINLLGEMSFPVAQRLTELNIPFVFATGYEHSTFPAILRAAPIWSKPFDSEALARALDLALGRQASEASRR